MRAVPSVQTFLKGCRGGGGWAQAVLLSPPVSHPVVCSAAIWLWQFDLAAHRTEARMAAAVIHCTCPAAWGAAQGGGCGDELAWPGRHFGRAVSPGEAGSAAGPTSNRILMRAEAPSESVAVGRGRIGPRSQDWSLGPQTAGPRNPTGWPVFLRLRLHFVMRWMEQWLRTAPPPQDCYPSEHQADKDPPPAAL